MELEGLVDGVLEGVVFQVVEMDDTHALLDGNHPYAGVPMIATDEVLEIEYLSDEAIDKILQHEEH
jgi:FKBP-type peptidyl-prolyl cis-trans isomerase 2